MKVSMKKGIGFYMRSVTAFLKGIEAKPADGDKPAVEAKPAVDELKISGLGDAINTAIAAGRPSLHHRRHRLLEEVERVVVVEHLDGLADSGDLLGAHLLALGPLGLLLRALLAQVAQESLRLRDLGL